MPENEKATDVASLAVQLLSAYLGNNTVAPETIADLIRSTKAALTEDAPASSEPAVQEAYTPAVSVRKSLASPDHILSMIDGKPYKLLKRHLTTHGLTPEEYRERYKLPATYPMVAPTFAAQRREVAEKIGLGGRAKATARNANVAPQQPSVSSATAPVEASAPIATKPVTKEAAAAKTKVAARKASVKTKPSSSAPKVAAKKTSAKASVKQAAVSVDVAAPAAGSEAASVAEAKAPAASATAKRATRKPAAAKPAGKSASRATKAVSARAETKAPATPEPAGSSPAAAAKPARARRKLALFGRQESPEKSGENAPVGDAAVLSASSPVEGAQKGKGAKAPRQKRMARTPKPAVDVKPKNGSVKQN